MGRPSLKTDSRVAILLDALKRAIPFNRACELAMIDRVTGWRWKEKDKDFATQTAYATAIGIGEVIQETRKKDPWKILKNIDSEHFKDEIVEKKTVDHTLTVIAGHESEI